jgi:2',3'-cyclic-nucleotide 2'-phosphodiesterase (5'-nucleotidase family)
MNVRTCRLVAVTSILIALAIAPFRLAAEDDEFHHGDAKVTILQTTDLHDHANGVDHLGLDVDPVTGTSLVGSYARIATYINYVRQTADHPVILVDSGDWTMGTLYDFTLGTRPWRSNSSNACTTTA